MPYVCCLQPAVAIGAGFFVVAWQLKGHLTSTRASVVTSFLMFLQNCRAVQASAVTF